MASRIRDTLTPEGEQFYRMLAELADKEVHIGFQHGEASEKDGTDICDIAAWNELGTEHIPPRPFLRKSVDENQDKINQFLQRKVRSLANGKTAEELLNEIGNYQKKLIQQKIREGEFAPNSGITINGGWMRNKKTGKAFYVKWKNSSKPLIDTGRMRQSVNYVIKRKGQD